MTKTKTFRFWNLMVNKTSSAVHLKHLPSGIEVKARKERSQAINRFLAWRLLADRLEARQSGLDQQLKKAERIRKQKERRLRKTQGREKERNYSLGFVIGFLAAKMKGPRDEKLESRRGI